MRRDVQARIRKRVRDRLDELKMTGRELARACGHSDAWISGILVGRDGLHWSDFDKVADKLGLSPSELVRHDDSETRELTPTEMSLLRHYRSWPKDIQERWLALMDFFSAELPDRDTAEFLDRLRGFPPSFRRPVLGWFSRCLLTGNIPLEEIVGGGAGGSTSMKVAPGTKRRHLAEKTRHGDQTCDDDQPD